MGNMLIDRILKTLAVVALISFIICSLCWLMKRPNRYQLIRNGETFVRLDTCTGDVDNLMLFVGTYKMIIPLTEKEYSVVSTEELFGKKK